MIDQIVHVAYQVLLYANTLLCVAVAVIYFIAGRKAKPRYRSFKFAIAGLRVSSFFVYTQLTAPGEFIGVVGMDALLVRGNYFCLLLVLLMAGLIGMAGHENR